jgi:hypothetical protein
MHEQTEAPTRSITLTLKQVPEWVWPIVAALVFFLVIFFFSTFRSEFQFNPDEGIELEKTLLMLRGYPLYDSIWNDQPPMLTYILSVVFSLFRPDVNLGRITVLVLSALLVLAAYGFLQMIWGHRIAWLGVLLLFFVPFYVQLSVSVMRGLPALTFVMLSLASLTAWHTRRNKWWLVLSAVLMVVSVLIKLYTAAVIPVFMLGILIQAYLWNPDRHKWWQILQPAVIWGSVFAVLLVILSLILIRPANLYEVFWLPFTAAGEEFFDRGVRYTLESNLEGRPFFWLAALSLPYIVAARRWLTLYAVGWLGIAYVVLSNYRPVWYHQQLLMLIPAALLAAVATGEALRILFRWQPGAKLITFGRLFSLLVLGVTGFTLFTSASNPLQELQLGIDLQPQTLTTRDREYLFAPDVFATAQMYAPEANMMLTDLPMYAFRLNLPVPPQTAVFSEKWFKTRYFSQNDLIRFVEEYQPELVLIGRFNLGKLENNLGDAYTLIAEQGQFRLYLRQ